MDRRSEASFVALAGLAALAAAMGIGRFAFTPLLPMMTSDHGLTVAQGGWLASANYAGYLAGALSAVWLRAAPKAVIAASLVSIAVATMGMAFTGSVAAWFALRAIAGVASAWALVFVSAWCLERLAPFERPILGSAVFAGVGAGIALAGGLCLVLMEQGADSSEGWLALGMASLTLGVLTWPIFTARVGNQPVPEGGRAGRLRWDRDTLLLVACYGVFGFGYIIPATFVPAMARQAVADPAVYGWSWPLFGLAAMASTLAATGWIVRFGNRRVWILGSLVMACGVAAPVLAPGLPAILVAAVCVGGTFMVVTMAGMHEARRVGGQQARSLMAAMTASFAAGQIAGPLAVSALSAAGRGIDVALVSSAVVLVASAAALGWPTPDERKTIEALPE
jgi:MFS family permease